MRTIVVKVRSSFPVAYDEYVAADNILSIDTPGRTSPMPDRMPFGHLPRPVYPLDTNVTWTNPLGVWSVAVGLIPSANFRQFSGRINSTSVAALSGYRAQRPVDPVKDHPDFS